MDSFETDCFETACKYWSAILNEFALQISSGSIPSITDVQWIYEKKRTKVCKADESGKKKRCAVGEKYYSPAALTGREANALWKLFQQFAQAQGFHKIERLRNNEKGLGRYDFSAENTTTRDIVYCWIDLPGEWNDPHISLLLFIGPRYRNVDLLPAEPTIMPPDINTSSADRRKYV